MHELKPVACQFLRLVFLICGLTFSHESRPLLANEYWIGFLSINEAPLSAVLNKDRIKRAVFQIETFARSNEYEPPEIIDISKIQNNDLLKGQTLFQYDDDQSTLAFQLQNCKNQSVIKCPVFKSLKVASGFAVEDNQTFGTARHVFHPWYHALIKHNPATDFTKILPPFQLRDASGKLVFSSIASDISGEIVLFARDSALFNAPTREQIKDETLRNMLSLGDYIEFRFSKPSFDSFLKRGRNSTDKKAVYLFGYPDISGFYKTQIVKKPKAGLPSDYSLVVSRGNIVFSAGLFLSTTALCFDGGSGGPAVDESGAAIGVISGQIKDSNGNFKLSAIISVDKTTFTKYWPQ